MNAKVESLIAKQMMIEDGVKDRVAYDSYNKGLDAYAEYYHIKKYDKKTDTIEFTYSEEERAKFLYDAKKYLEKAIKREPNNAQYAESYNDILNDFEK